MASPTARAALLTAALLVSQGTAAAGIIINTSVRAGTAGSPGGPAVNSITNIPGPSSYAYVRALPNTIQNPVVFQTGSGLDLNDAFCAFCGQLGEARGGGDGTAGLIKTFAGSGLANKAGGIANATVEITDTLTFSSPNFSFDLSALLSQFTGGGPVLSPPNSAYSSNISFQTEFRLEDEEDGIIYQALIVARRNYSHTPSPVLTTSYEIFEDLFGNGDTVLSTPAIPLGLNFAFSNSVNLGIYAGRPLASVFRARATSTCEYLNYLQANPSAGCTAAVNNWGTAYLRLTGDYTSQNGYQYPGPSDANVVPEPSTFSLAAVCCFAAWLSLRRRSQR
ncbi:MAG: hypothetical protein SFV54_25180 [Bryobacteraceae bacterium]|nr:hypothetical protein [Bryobacteraceae bacterium]